MTFLLILIFTCISDNSAKQLIHYQTVFYVPADCEFQADVIAYPHEAVLRPDRFYLKERIKIKNKTTGEELPIKMYWIHKSDEDF
jgi:hypothetical protein